jgi:LacI family transcriptional regulator
MNKKRPPTLKQIAELSGFSPASVSMILNGRGGASFSEETVRLVHEAAARLGYEKRPSAGKRVLGDHAIAVVCPNTSNPYYSTLLQAVEQAAWEKDYRVISLNTYRSPEMEERVLEFLGGAEVGGIIFAMPPQHPRALEMLNERLPVVVVGDRSSSLMIDTVEMDNYGAGVLIAKHLLGLGHRRAVFVSTPFKSNSVRLRRLEGIVDAYRKDCPDGSVSVKTRDIQPEEELRDLFIEHRVGYELALEALEDRAATAFIAVNDMVAYGVIDALVSAGLSIPGDISVCGFDNVFPSRLSPISLTSVDNCIVDKAHNAFAMILGRISGVKANESAPTVITRVEYPPRLIVRESTGSAAAQRLDGKPNGC